MEKNELQQLPDGTMQKKEASQDEYDVKKTKTRTLLTNKKEMRTSSKAGVRLEKIPENAISTSKLNQTKVEGAAPEGEDAQMIQLKNIKLSKEE